MTAVRCPFPACTWTAGDPPVRHEFRAKLPLTGGVRAALGKAMADMDQMIDQDLTDWFVDETTRHLEAVHPGWTIRDLLCGAGNCLCECHLHYTVHHVEPCCDAMNDGPDSLPGSSTPRTLTSPRPIDAWVMPLSPTIKHKPVGS